jgi:hypothetical protein
MSAIKCTGCGETISAPAVVCPNCGQSIAHATMVDPEQTYPHRSDVETPGRAAIASTGLSGEGRLSRLPTWLLFVLVFVSGSVILIAGVVATGIVFGSIVDEWEGFSTTGDTTAVITTVVTLPVGGEDGLFIGQCIDEDEMDKYLAGDDFSLVSCDQPHDAEVYFRYEFTSGPYPGDELVTDELKSVCRDEFEGYVGADFETSALNFWALWPTQGAWEAGNRLGECALFDLNSNKLTGSAYQSGW